MDIYNTVTISDGNSKMGKVPNVSQDPRYTCPAAAEFCKKDCFALNSMNRWTNVKKAWGMNYVIWRNNPERYFRDIETWLRYNHPAVFRWHVAGDIPSHKYYYRMCRIANWFEDIAFYAFTKNYEIDYKHAPNNLNIIISVWPGVPFPEELADSHGLAYIEGDPRIPKTHFTCQSNCIECQECFSFKRGALVLKKL